MSRAIYIHSISIPSLLEAGTIFQFATNLHEFSTKQIYHDRVYRPMRRDSPVNPPPSLVKVKLYSLINQYNIYIDIDMFVNCNWVATRWQ